VLEEFDLGCIDVGHRKPELAVVASKTLLVTGAIVVIKATGKISPSVLHWRVLTCVSQSIYAHVG